MAEVRDSVRLTSLLSGILVLTFIRVVLVDAGRELSDAHCSCAFCPGYGGTLSDGYAAKVLDPVCPSRSACPKPPNQKTELAFCFGMSADGLKNGTCSCTTGRFLEESGTEWIDVDTGPEVPRSMKSRSGKGQEYRLAFSDEFNVDGRKFDDASDPKWTALDRRPWTNSQVNRYLPEMAQTEGGRLKIHSRIAPEDFDREYPAPYHTAMLQSWNKFCFRGGIVDVHAKLPGDGGGRGAGLWPGVWMMGNLARATFLDSTEGLWPFSASSTCPDGRHNHIVNAIDSQTLNACNGSTRSPSDNWKPGYDRARGSCEIDLLEAMLGDRYDDFHLKVVTGRCQEMRMEMFDNLIINPQPFISQSLVLAPGIPMWSVARPKTGCFWSDVGPVWHKELFPRLSPTYPKFPDNWTASEPCRIPATGRMKEKICPTLPNVNFFGANLSTFSSEGLTANTQLPLISFQDGVNLRLELNIEAGVSEDSEDIALAFYIDDLDTPVFQIPASTFAALNSPGGDQPAWRMEPRAIPAEPMYLILNVDISPTWGWPTDGRCCNDCTKDECLTCNPPGFPREYLRSFCELLKSGNGTTFEIDYVRVYTNTATCEPPEAPTKTYIGLNADKYYDKTVSSEYPLKCVRPGGGACSSSNSSCGGGDRGKCIDGRCECFDGWTGPDCLVPAVGPSKVCPYFLEAQGEDFLQFSDYCISPETFNSEEVADAYHPSEGHLVDIVLRNCEKVFAYSHLNTLDLDMDDAKRTRVAKAVGLCRTVMFDGVFGECCPEVRANLALKAWSDLVTMGGECCNLPGPPYCYSRWGHFAFYRVFLIGFPISAFCIVFVVTHWEKSKRTSANETDEHLRKRGTRTLLQESRIGKDEKESSLQDELEREFLSSFFWREHRHSSEAWLPIVCGAFANLASQFGFQDDSVKNQLQHFFSLWQSQVVLLKDTQEDQSENSEDDALLERAMLQLGSKLLRGYEDWASGAGQNVVELNLYQRGVILDKIACFQKPGITPIGTTRTPTTISKYYCLECAAFLLVWGEAGVLRFCPELLCFLVDCVLCDAGKEEEKKADRKKEEDDDMPLSGCANPGSDPVVLDSRMRSPGDFLCTVIRPIYNTIFSETYQCVNIDPKSHDDKKKLFPDCVSYIPADKSNYDDWNELFNNVALLNERLCSSLRAAKAGTRIKMLCEIDWNHCLSGYKTHREVHSYWSVFVAFHRLVYLHELMFVMVAFACIESPDRKFVNGPPIMGEHMWVRIGAGGLLAPCHTILDEIALRIIRPHSRCRKILTRLVGCLAPLVTYIIIRLAEHMKLEAVLDISLPIHATLSLLSAVLVLFVPRGTEREYFHQLRAARSTFSLKTCLRICYWIALLGLQCYTGYLVNIASTITLLEKMGSLILSQPVYVIALKIWSLNWDYDLMFWMFAWGCTFLAFCASSYFWFTLGNCVLGLLVALHQRSWKLFSLVFVNAIAEIESRIHSKVLMHQKSKHDGQFQKLWDRVIQEMYENHKLTTAEKLRMSFGVSVGERITWHVPPLFEHYGGSSWNMPVNMEAQWRIHAIARCLSLRMPRPFCLPDVPCLTTLIPHYGETILQEWSNLVPELQEHVGEDEIQETALLEWLMARYSDEWHMFLESNEETRHASTLDIGDIKEHAENDHIRLLIERWASMRTQTLWRTVVGICKYQTALELLAEKPGEKLRFRSEECFRCLVAMQRYVHFSRSWYLQVEAMFEELPSCLNIAFIDYEDDEADALANANIHPNQHRRYYACLIDKDCGMCVDNPHRRVPRFKVELPGFPILGDGKGDNQNCAIIYSRGEFIQAIDANQGGYLEQMLLLPNMLAEFRENAKRIVGAPEHITSDFGSIGDFASSSELAFGTIIQRSVAAQGGRMHYGHPDLMNKIYMIHQGGVSKATKTINLSEDIFAGMDFVLRGGEIVHREFFHVTKGRDLGFTAVLSFFSKLSAGTGEQVLTRQVLRISRSLGLERVLPFYHNHAGFYFMQFLSAQVIIWLSHVWMLASFFTVSTRHGEKTQIVLDSHALLHSHRGTNALFKRSVFVVEWLAMNYGPYTFLYIMASSFPLLIEIWFQQGLWRAIVRISKQMVTFAPLHFIFQGKVIAHYISNEVLYGGAKYIATGRELPTHRKPFVGSKESPGLYQEFAEIAHYDGCRLLNLVIAIMGAALRDGDEFQLSLVTWLICCGLVIVSWLWTPYIFNPYQCDQFGVARDRKAWWAFFVHDGSKAWKEWCHALINRRSAVNHAAFELVFWIFWIFPVYSLVTTRLYLFSSIFGHWGNRFWWRFLVNLPAASQFLVTGALKFMFFLGKEPTPLTVSAVGSLFWLVEVVVSCYPFYAYGWNRSWINVVLYKIVAVEFWMWSTESMLRVFPTFVASRMWLLGWRLLRDLWTSSVILFPMMFISFGSNFRQVLCCSRDSQKHDRCPIHNLIVFRAFGGDTRRRVSLQNVNVEMEELTSSLVKYGPEDI